MEWSWQIIVALVVYIPVILAPAAFVWFLNFGGGEIVSREWAKWRAEREKEKLAPEDIDI